ncbi:peptidoglycan DD-metalloendopeptidase family protein [Gracilibacillus sp. HCP3S3_G5_1]|uniref:peptidoglycan DD-metalloendopeptidase family protein n=1 Tax=unclassified Gracilibacillus TaxID=2625209 RepID=UPI003F8CEB6B
MKKDNLSQIRQNITKRKKSQKKINLSRTPKVKHHSYLNQAYLEDEERHGYSPTAGGYPHKSDQPYLQPFLVKGMVAAIIFFVTVFSMASNQKWLEQPRNWVSYAMTEEFPFASVNAWYQARFGAPFAIEADLSSQEEIEPTALPVSGQINQTFQENGEGILISSAEETEVIAVDAGTVLFAGNDRGTGKTVIVQHADRSKSIYGNLTNIDVHSYQSIRENQKIGSYEPSETNTAMYFAIEKNREYLDPIRVIHVDEQL